MVKLARYIVAVLNLRPSQIVYLVWYRLYRPSLRVVSVPTLSCAHCNAKFARTRHPPAFDSRGATFFGARKDIPFDETWHVQEQTLWIYNLHYFDDVWTRDAAGKGKVHDKLIALWIRANSDSTAAAWDSYPVSRRIVNWCKHLWATADERSDDTVLQSLAMQADFLLRRLEFHLLANHLFANAKALIFAGTILGGAMGRRMLNRGIGLLRREIAEQFLADGGHFERSPMYHNSMTWDVLDILAIARSNCGQPLEGCELTLERTAAKAIAFAKQISHLDGRIPFFNDSTFGVAPECNELFTYAGALGIRVTDTEPVQRTPDGLAVYDLAESGFTVVQAPQYKAVLNTGGIAPSYQPGHCHADTLAFELSLETSRIFVNAGTSEYECGSTRDYERSTAAHNTVEIAGDSSSEVWGAFRVARRARVVKKTINQSNGLVRISCSHDGYRRHPIRSIHRRTWGFQSRGVDVVDSLCGEIESGVARFHLHPDVEVETESGGYFLDCGKARLHLEFSVESVDIEKYSWRPGMRRREDARVFVVRFDTELRTSIALIDFG